MTKTNKIVYYVLLVIVSVMFVFSGWMKVSSDPMSVEGFTSAGLALWFMYFIGAAEIAGGIGLWITKFQKWAICGLSIIMVGAIVVTLMNQPAYMTLMPVIFLVAMWYIGKLGKKRSVAPMSAPMTPPTTI